MKFSSLVEWLGWLEQCHPKEIDLGLTRIQLVAERLNLLKPNAKVITVAGTNGKGSCVTATAGLLQAAGFSVGVYTSPHLLHYAERIQLNGEPVADALICNAFEKIFRAANEISLTYFEYGTLASLLIFNEHAVDFMVLEVGLGGRLDAVNIIDADVAVITSIAIDHQDWLGDNREAIGFEKAGILRANQIFICADENPPQSIVDVSQKLNTRSLFISRDFSYVAHKKNWQWRGLTQQRNVIELSEMLKPHLPLPSLAAAIQVVHVLAIALTHNQIENTLLNLRLLGRFQKVVFNDRTFILDVAHNPAATAYFSERLAAEPVTGKTRALVAMMADKDRQASLANLAGQVDEWYLLDLTSIPRAASVQMLSQDLSRLHVREVSSGEIALLMRELIAKSNANDRILIFGSFFTVAAALTYLQTDLQSSRGSQ